MYPQKTVELPPPPGVMGSLRAGFDAVSRHIVLILLPAALDILLWLGPRFSVEGVLAPILNMIFDQTRLTLSSSGDVRRFTEFESLFNQTVEHFNLLSLLSRLQTFPVGVSSLLARTMPVETPLGLQPVIQISSFPGLIALALLLVTGGWVLGALYFRWVSGTTLGETAPGTGMSSLWAIFQTLILSGVWLVGLMMFFIPVAPCERRWMR